MTFRPCFSSQGLTEAAQQLRESEESRTSALDASRRLVDEFEDQKRLAKETEAQQKQLTEQLKASGQEVRVLCMCGGGGTLRTGLRTRSCLPKGDRGATEAADGAASGFGARGVCCGEGMTGYCSGVLGGGEGVLGV